MEQNTFITLLAAIITISVLILFQIFVQRDKLLDKITILDLYGSGAKPLRKIKDIEEHPRASIIIKGHYVQARQQLNSVANGLIINVLIFGTPLIINILNNICVKDEQILSTFRYIIIFLSFVWLVINIYWLKKYDANNRKVLSIV